MTLPSALLLRRLYAGFVELCLLLGMYAAYSVSRLAADGSPGPAARRAQELLVLERPFGLDVEHLLNDWFVAVPSVGIAGSYFYASAHYLVTAAVLVWLWRRGPAVYVPARRALVAATLAALVLYLLLPTAPPRFVEGYTDVLQLYSAHGWWGGDASAPRGLGGYTNELAALPSMHAGWALWVTWVVRREVRRPWVRALAWTHAVVTTIVIIGTGNHWVLDAVAGWIVIGAAFAVVGRPDPVSAEAHTVAAQVGGIDRMAA